MADDWDKNGCFISFRGAIPHKNPPICDIIYVKMESLTSGLNVYDMFRHVYPDADMVSDSSRMGEVMINGEVKRYKRGFTLQEYAPWSKKSIKSPLLGAFVTDYINREDVREAMNIPTDTPAWVQCATINYSFVPEASYWIYPLLKNKYRILIYSGDTDGIVPTYGTRQWIANLKWEILAAWRPFYTGAPG